MNEFESIFSLETPIPFSILWTQGSLEFFSILEYFFLGCEDERIIRSKRLEFLRKPDDDTSWGGHFLTRKWISHSDLSGILVISIG